MIYAECAGLLYLGNRVDNKKMSGILDINFTLKERFVRMGYYYSSSGVKGHAFHYTNAVDLKNGVESLSKKEGKDAKISAWQSGKVFGTYLHTMLRNNTEIIKKRFLC